MKIHVWSLAAREEAVSYSLARGKAAAVTRESGEVLGSGVLSGAARAVSCTWAVPRRDRGKTPKPLLSCISRPSLDTMRGARALKITLYHRYYTLRTRRV